MRFRHPDGSTVHLAYCTNVHPAETLDGVLAQLRDHCEPVRRRLGRDRLGIGLWLARAAAHTLVSDPAALRGLRAELDRRGLEVVTLNGFPYEGFGAQEVKYRVYKPDWTDPERLAYTTTLARLLAVLLPDDVSEGSISTLPLAWRIPYEQDPAAADTARAALTTLAERLDALEDLTGKSIRIGLEPEPGCTIETTADAIAPLGELANPRIGVCVDTCHLATSFEDPATALNALAAADITIAKAQLSAALHAEHPHLPEVRSALAHFAEPRFLHQTRTAPDTLHGTDDLPEALTPRTAAAPLTSTPPAGLPGADLCETAPPVALPGADSRETAAPGAVVCEGVVRGAAASGAVGESDPPRVAASGAVITPAATPLITASPAHPAPRVTVTTTPALTTDPLTVATTDPPVLTPAAPPTEATPSFPLPTASPWRAHFHVPLHAPPAPPLTSTLSVLQDVLTRLMGGPSGHPLTRHLEVETYTWQALPQELRPRTRAQLADGIAAELTLARDLLADLGLKELP
ncbi:metabolite traffic protein EboE [Streptomyces sp. NPDC091272]|uniref:metabolite traffic protein EboE n=1 Tax=Streptomyces sp. NPDC091272 TaxID=3365981 RepID=UPI0037F43B59